MSKDYVVTLALSDSEYFDNNIPLTCFHFDVVKKVYIPQEVL